MNNKEDNKKVINPDSLNHQDETSVDSLVIDASNGSNLMLQMGRAKVQERLTRPESTSLNIVPESGTTNTPAAKTTATGSPVNNADVEAIN